MEALGGGRGADAEVEAKKAVMGAPTSRARWAPGRS